MHQAVLYCYYPPEVVRFMSIELVLLYNDLILCHPLLFLPSVLPRIRIFSSMSALRIRWLKYWNFNFCSSLSKEYSGLIFFRIDWFDLLAVQGTLKSLLSITVGKHKFVIAQLSLWSSLKFVNDYWKNHTLNIQTIVCQVISLHFSILFRFVIVSLPLQFSSLQSLSCVRLFATP